MAAAESPAQGDLLVAAPLFPGKSRGALVPFVCDQGLRLTLTYGDLQVAQYDFMCTSLPCDSGLP